MISRECNESAASRCWAVLVGLVQCNHNQKAEPPPHAGVAKPDLYSLSLYEDPVASRIGVGPVGVNYLEQDK